MCLHISPTASPGQRCSSVVADARSHGAAVASGHPAARLWWVSVLLRRPLRQSCAATVLADMNSWVALSVCHTVAWYLSPCL